jgi:hypothetical protein
VLGRSEDMSDLRLVHLPKRGGTDTKEPNEWYEAYDKDGVPMSDSLIDAMYLLKQLEASGYDDLEGLLERLIARKR